MSSSYVPSERKARNEDKAIYTKIAYLLKDKVHETEKPYEIMYDNGGVILPTNMSLEYHSVQVQDFRPHLSSRSFDEHGFTLANIDCPLKAADFDNEKTITRAYYPVIEKLLWKMFPSATKVKIMEHNVRKRPVFKVLT